MSKADEDLKKNQAKKNSDALTSIADSLKTIIKQQEKGFNKIDVQLGNIVKKLK